MRSAKVDAAIQLVLDEKATSFADAARKTGCSREGVWARWKSDFGDENPPFATSDPDEVQSIVERALAIEDEIEEVSEPTEIEKQLARKVLDADNRARRAGVEARTAKNAANERDEKIVELEDALNLTLEVKEKPIPEWMFTGYSDSSYRATLMACFSDYHFGERVRPSEIANYNAYDVDIATKRVERFFERTITMSRRHLSGVEYDGIVMPNLGDTISGDIHEEFVQTNELTNSEAVPIIVPLLIAGIGTFADEYGKVYVPCAPGNHPRDEKKPRYKERSAHNADIMIARLVANYFNNDDRVVFDIPDGISTDFQIYNTRFRAEHGDEAKGGTGIQGALAPLALFAHRRRKQAEAEGVPFDVILVGHWHQYMTMLAKGLIVNGAGKGYDEYARGKGFEPEPPQQSLSVITPEHGVTWQAPLFVGKRSDEGW